MRNKVGDFDLGQKTMDQMGRTGLILTSGREGNPMAIGWGTVGIIWGRPVFLVLVRPSRYTFGLMEGHPEFIVNVPTDDMKEKVNICGSVSGRDTDKINKCGFTMKKGKDVAVPFIEDCPVHYECKVIHKNNVINANLSKDIVAGTYASGDFHTIYYGQILGVYRES